MKILFPAIALISIFITGCSGDEDTTDANTAPVSNTGSAATTNVPPTSSNQDPTHNTNADSANSGLQQLPSGGSGDY